MWLRILHSIGFTNLSDEQVRDYEARLNQATSNTSPLEKKEVTQPKADASAAAGKSSGIKDPKT